MSDLNIPWQSSADIRRKFIEFFEARGHLHVPSSSLIPHNDRTVLLTTAGMQQMTPYFLGLETPPAERMCTIQKCFRTVDIDEVGDESHSTFFFMLGNFSVRDYFKAESLAWSYEFLTDPKWMGIPAEVLYPTVHPEDEEAWAIWRDQIGVPEERLSKLDDNWWRAGPTGPNGPDSEIYIDRGESFEGNAPGDDGPRYLETWNNVFMQYNTTPDGERHPLQKPCVDTGMGFERLVLLVQGGRTMYDTDLYSGIIGKIEELSGVQYDVDPQTTKSIRIIADHLRGAVFLIGDGVLPGNEGRAYVLRRVLRKAIRHGRLIGLDEPFIEQVAQVVIDQFGDDYAELRDREVQILKVLRYEEASFSKTLVSGMNRLNELIHRLKEQQPAGSAEATDNVNAMIHQAHQASKNAFRAATGYSTPGEIKQALVIPGEEVFRLYDTFGFPYDLTAELAREEGLEIDDAGFNEAMQKQRVISRSLDHFKDASRDRGGLYGGIQPRTEFLGYDDVRAEVKIVALLDKDGTIERAEAGQEIEVVLDRTPFYGESGGQIGDTGEIRTDTGVINIDDTRKPAPDLFVHRGTVSEGFVNVGDDATAEIDAIRRQGIRRNHTATHLLHKALRMVIGPEAHQAGSLVAEDRLRFDFSSLDPISDEDTRKIAQIVNLEVASDRPVTTTVTSYRDAVAEGAMALFGEKYGETVRLVAIDDFSKELCGGTHVLRTGEIGPFVITAESSVAAGTRRIEALTGIAAIEHMLGQQRVLGDLGQELKVAWTEVPTQVRHLQDRSRDLEREITRLRGQLAGAKSGDLIEQAIDVAGVRVLSSQVDVDGKDGLRQLGDRLRDSLQSGVIALGTVADGKPSLLVMVTPDIVGRGVRAGDIVRRAVTHIEGRGGGRPELAEAGGKNPDGIDAALEAVSGIVSELLVAK